MLVKLLAYTPNPEKIVACAAKLCYASCGVADLFDSLTDDKVAAFIKKLADLGHESPIEHVSFTFAIEGISRACSHQLVRHRIASFSQQSQRYVDMNDFSYVVPPEIAEDNSCNDAFSVAMEECVASYKKLADMLTERYTVQLESEGIVPAIAADKAKKKAQEDARFVLPNACDTRVIVTMNARSLLNFFKHRCCNRAQWEIKAVADEMLRLVCGIAPNIFSSAGPDCYKKSCPEGAMSCGKATQMRDFYSSLHANLMRKE